VRKYFKSEADNLVEKNAHRTKKKEWVKDWKDITCKLLEIDVIIESADLAEALKGLNLSEAKSNAMTVELSIFEPYFGLSNGKIWKELRYDDADKSNYFKFCSGLIGVSCNRLQKTCTAFYYCARKITTSITGPNWSWAWIVLGAAVLLITAPYLAGMMGGAMGFGGAAATSAGLAFLGGGSLAAGGLGMTGGYFALMAGGAILG